MDRDKALDMALGQIEKQFGKGAIMRMDEQSRVKVPAIPTGALSLDLALGVGGLPRGRVVEIYGPESSGKCLTAGSYLWTERGLETVEELFERCGQPASCTSRITDVRGLDVRVVNEHADLERVAALTHNDRRPVRRVTLESGRSIEATCNHPLRVLSDGRIVWKETGELIEGDVVVSALFGANEAPGAGDLTEDEALLLAEELPADGAIPHRVRIAGPKVQAAFLSALYEEDGCIEKGPQVGYTSTSRTLAEQLQLLLYGFGIPATLRTGRSRIDDRDEHTVLIAPAGVQRFLDTIGFRSARRAEQVARHAGTITGRSSHLETDADYSFEQVVRLEDAGEQPTFDVALPGTHSFVANGFLSHNTTVALHAIAEAQKTGGIAAFIDAEHALDPTYAQALGVNVEDLLVSQPDTGEQALEITDMLVRSGAIDVVVIDSVAALTPRAEIEGEMGDSHVGLQARLMSQALRKLASTLNRSKTCAIFINQIREKIGVMFGCMSWDTRVTLADGSQESIGRIVDDKMPVEVLSYDHEAGRIVPKRVTNWFDNGPTGEFVHVTVADGGPSGKGGHAFACTPNHQVMTPFGWREAADLKVGDRVVRAVPHFLSGFQREALLGMVMGDAALSANHHGPAASVRWAHSAKLAGYADWKASLFANVGTRRTTGENGAVFHDLPPLVELAELHDAVDIAGQKVLSWDYLKRLTPFALALWYMDDGAVTVRQHGGQGRVGGQIGRAEICVQALEASSRTRLQAYLADEWGIDSRLAARAGKAVLEFPTAETDRFQALIAPYVPPSMEHKLLPRHRGKFHLSPAFDGLRHEPLAMPVTAIEVRPALAHRPHRYDIEVEGTHNYFVDGVMVHNSPETTPGGRALKFYSSVRLDVRRIESLKDGTDFVGNRVRVKVVKNKCVAEGTRVFDPTTGTTHRIEDIVDAGEAATVWAADKRGALHVKPITARLDQGRQEVISLRLRDGTTLRVTPDHRILTEHGWRLAGELTTADRVARPRQAGGFGSVEALPVEQAGLIGERIADGADERIPAAFFDPEISAEVVATLLSAIWESDGWIGRQHTRGLRAGFATSSEQLAWQLHWLLLRWGIVSSVTAHEPGERPSVVAGRRTAGELARWSVGICGHDNVTRFAQALPMSGPKGRQLARALADPAMGKHHGAATLSLSGAWTEPVLGHLRDLGLSPRQVAGLVGLTGNQADGGVRAVLGTSRLRRDRVARLADALDSPFLREALAEELYYERVVDISGRQLCRTFDLEVDDLHNFVADDVVVHNCAPPFRQAEFDILFGEGISREGSILDVAVEHGIVRKAGAWYTYDGEQLGQGRENARQFLKEHDDVTAELYKKVTEKLNLVPTDVTGEDTPDADG